MYCQHISLFYQQIDIDITNPKQQKDPPSSISSIEMPNKDIKMHHIAYLLTTSHKEFLELNLEPYRRCNVAYLTLQSITYYILYYLSNFGEMSSIEA